MSYWGNFARAAVFAGLGLAAGCNPGATRNEVTRMIMPGSDGRSVVVYIKGEKVCKFVGDDIDRLDSVYEKSGVLECERIRREFKKPYWTYQYNKGDSQ